ncbi:tyrosine-type recombinase/integrase [Azospirillum sp. TSA2s]|uniref:tyrosine-type recombinase/integrase n=1 Tax=Azospirillum sp. TSA2s TaxID=709810 RepID=UPI001FFF14EC|nr:tyrosine-type recombinase/integrase [Azospirillum sp. TSA2s]
MRAGPVPAAAMHACDRVASVFPPRHCDDAEYVAYIHGLPLAPKVKRQRIAIRRRFERFWPDLADWFAAPMGVRVARLPARHRGDAVRINSYAARSYLYYLALTDRIRLDPPWLLAIGDLRAVQVAASLGIDLGIELLAAEAAAHGLERFGAKLSLAWGMARIALCFGARGAAAVSDDHVDALMAAIREFGARPDVGEFWGSTERFRVSPAKAWVTHLGRLRMILYHRGQAAAEPRKAMPGYAAPAPPQVAMLALVERWLEVRRLTDNPSTVYHLSVGMRHFLHYLAETVPEVQDFGAVTRDHAQGFMHRMATEIRPTTGRILAPNTRRDRTGALAQFCRQTAAWGWEGAPPRQLVDRRDYPRAAERIPRYIPADELARLMVAIRSMTCVYQRAALLVARWSGARRAEVRRLAIDCLDRYPDGTARLRLPAGKTLRERIVPLHDEAAEAIRGVQALRDGRPDRPCTDEVTGLGVRYLFVMNGRRLSLHYLFETALQAACREAGLVDARGRGTVSAHRFRHTVGTELAEKGARLHTIMSILGHQSPAMSMVYARISDPEVLRDYRSVLGPGAVIAGPGVEALRAGRLSDEAVDWLKLNFLKTELELGHCLRLPSEGPCECDLYLTCARFVTTPAYAGRLRERRHVEMTLVEDARCRGWPREVDRHRAVVARIEGLLGELGEPIDPPPQG